MGSDGMEDLRCHTVVTSQNGWLKTWNLVVLDGEDWYNVRRGRLIIIPDGTEKERTMLHDQKKHSTYDFQINQYLVEDLFLP